jgi:hypothetical protein
MASTFSRINAGTVYLTGPITDPTQAASMQWVQAQIAALGTAHAPVSVAGTAQSVVIALAGQQITAQVNLLATGFVPGQGQLAQTVEGKLYGILGTTSYVAAAGNHTHAAASAAVAGFMSAADKAKLDGVAAAATAIALAGNGTAATAAHSDHTHTAVTNSASGLMTPTMLADLEAASPYGPYGPAGALRVVEDGDFSALVGVRGQMGISPEARKLYAAFDDLPGDWVSDFTLDILRLENGGSAAYLMATPDGSGVKINDSLIILESAIGVSVQTHSAALDVLAGKLLSGTGSIVLTSYLAAQIAAFSAGLSGATLKLRRGTAAEVAAIIPADGEPVWESDTKRLRVGDGATLGGFRNEFYEKRGYIAAQITVPDDSTFRAISWTLPGGTTASAIPVVAGDIIEMDCMVSVNTAAASLRCRLTDSATANYFGVISAKGEANVYKDTIVAASSSSTVGTASVDATANLTAVLQLRMTLTILTSGTITLEARKTDTSNPVTLTPLIKPGGWFRFRKVNA